MAHYRQQAAITIAIEQLLKQDAITFQDPDVVIESLARFNALRKVNFSDCLVLEIARKAGQMPLGTLDRAFSKLDGVELIG